MLLSKLAIPQSWGPLSVSWDCQSSGLIFSLLPLKVTRGQCIRRAILSECSRTRTPRSASALYGAEGRVCQGKGWRDVCVCVSLGSLGLVRPCVWLQLHRRLACGAKPCPAFSPVNDSCSLGVGALVSCNSCRPPLSSTSWWARGRGGRRPVVPEAPLQLVRVCLGVHCSFLVTKRGLQG